MTNQKSEKPDSEKPGTGAGSEAAKTLSSLGASKGGRARASVLSGEERKAIARNAIAARWAKAKGVNSEEQKQQVSEVVDQYKSIVLKPEPRLPVALFPGRVSIGVGKYMCYVLDNGKRVISQREVVRALTGQSKGDIARYLDAQNLKRFISNKLVADQTVQFTIPGNPKTSNGYEATLLLDICDAYLKARDEGLLASSQMHLAKQAEIITRASAKVGIIALIDEATGFDKFKKKQEYQLKLQAFIADELQEWAKMFPDDFWFELARLEGVHYSPRSRPLRWGRYVMMFVYDAVDVDVGKELRKKNPDPHFLSNHHQWLKKFGRNKVHDQITKVVTVMKLCNDMGEFRQKFSRLFDRQLNFGFTVTV